MGYAVLLVDPASCHTAFENGEQIRRDQLCEELRLKIKHAPAGFSAAGQPGDQIHASLQVKVGRFMTEIVGEQLELFRRPEEHPVTSAGNLSSISALQEVECDVRAIR